MTHTLSFSPLARITQVLAFSCIFLFFFLFSAQTAEAVVGKPAGSVLRIGQNAALFMVTFELGSNQGDFLVPSGALRSTDDELDIENTHYYIEDKSGDIVMDGTASGLLLSGDAPYSDGAYRVPQGESATFTLLVLFVTDEKDPAYHLRMRTLPFAIDGYLSGQQYNRHELQYHTSPSVGLNESK